ncbi:4'-phosphopantetheinyl transferase superfamily protein [Cellulosimicrobium sp. PMB13]|uniref:4'-phosphopantetheinyl transferase family protein n=1 Tax=Cellulosimicrobium sp. PMB13 TaxID=3120158 RepID=UPI003F4B3AFC
MLDDLPRVEDLPGLARATFAERSPSPRVSTEPAVWWGTVERCAAWASRLGDRVLDADERARADRYVHDADRATYVVSHVVLRLLLARELSAEPQDVSPRPSPCPSCGGPHGKPVLDGGPHFSLAHTLGAFAVAIGPTPVGVDVEGVPDHRVVRSVSSSLHPRERAEIADHAQDARGGAFARTWTRKEAYLKAIGTGLSRDLSLDDVGAGPVPRSPGPGWHVADVQLPEPFTGAVAWCDPDAPDVPADDPRR